MIQNFNKNDNRNESKLAEFIYKLPLVMGEYNRACFTTLRIKSSNNTRLHTINQRNVLPS